MRIVYCYNTLWKTGGIETITAIKANALSRLEGNDVWVVVTDSPDHAPDVLSPNVHLVDLGIHYDKISWRFPLNLIQLLPKRCLHRKKLRRLFHEIHPDVVISAGGHERKILPFLHGPWVLIRECHTITNYHQISQNNLVKTTRWLGEMIEFRLFSKRYDRIVVLTEEDKRINWHNNDRVIVLENPLRFSLVKLSSLTKKKVISVGRLSPVKGFSQLIRAFKTVVDLYPDWELHIFGDGPERESLLDEIQTLGLQNSVSLHGTTKQVQEEQKSGEEDEEEDEEIDKIKSGVKDNASYKGDKEDNKSKMTKKEEEMSDNIELTSEENIDDSEDKKDFDYSGLLNSIKKYCEQNAKEKAKYVDNKFLFLLCRQGDMTKEELKRIEKKPELIELLLDTYIDMVKESAEEEKEESQQQQKKEENKEMFIQPNTRAIDDGEVNREFFLDDDEFGYIPKPPPPPPPVVNPIEPKKNNNNLDNEDEDNDE